jgi:hypothetical protein
MVRTNTNPFLNLWLKMRRMILVFFLTLYAFISFSQNIPLLKISENERFIVDENGKPFFWLGDTGWLLFSKLNREDAEKYITDREKKGFNVIQVMVLHDLKKAVNVYGDSALIKNNIAHTKTTKGNSFTVTGQYDYWDHVDFIINLAAKHGIYVALVPVWGSNVKAGFVNREQAKIYATFLANRYKDKKNIIWINGGDIKGSDSTEIWKIIGNTLRANDPNHLITFHPYGRHTSSLWFHNEKWLDFNMFQSGHKNYEQDTMPDEQHFGPDNWKYVNHDLALSPQKPTLDGEPSYEQIPWGLHDTLQPYWTENDVRRYAYWEIFAGGCGFTYGNNSVMQFYHPGDKEKAYGARSYWYDAINAPGAKQMIHLKNLMLSHSYQDRVPDQSIIFGDPGWKFSFITATRGKNYIMVYTYTGRKFKLNMGKIPGKSVKASWFNPRNGETSEIGIIKNEGIVDFAPPGIEKDGNDRVLLLESLL